MNFEEPTQQNSLFSTLDLRNEERKKLKRINKIIELISCLDKKDFVIHNLSKQFKIKTSLENKIFLILYNYFLPINPLKSIEILQKFPGNKNELLRLNFKQFGYCKNLEHFKIIYDAMFNYINQFVDVNYDLEFFLEVVKSKEPVSVAVVLLIRRYGVEQMYEICKLYSICDLNKLKITEKNIFNDKIKRKNGKKVTLNKIFREIQEKRK